MEVRYHETMKYFMADGKQTIRCGGQKYYKDIDEMYQNMLNNVYLEHENEFRSLEDYEVIGKFNTIHDFKLTFAEYII